MPSNATSSINDQTERTSNIYPNPASDLLTIKMDKSYPIIEVSILEQSGRVLFNKAFSGSGINLDLSGYNTGLYIVRLKTNELVSNQNLIIR